MEEIGTYGRVWVVEGMSVESYCVAEDAGCGRRAKPTQQPTPPPTQVHDEAGGH
jgi:hypothetical protein